jgi:hypothetical protein
MLRAMPVPCALSWLGIESVQAALGTSRGSEFVANMLLLLKARHAEVAFVRAEHAHESQCKNHMSHGERVCERERESERERRCSCTETHR